MSEELIKRLSLRANNIDLEFPKFAALLREAVDALSTPPAAVAVPDGMVLVPVEPTTGMESAGADALEDKNAATSLCADARNVYRAMLAAAPASPAAVAVPDGMVLVRRKLIDESIARINCAIPGWEVHVHALNDALAAAPAAPSVRAVAVPEGYRLQPHSEFDAMNAFIRGETKVPPGYALVPVEPTPEMLAAAVPFPEHLRLRHPDDATWEARMQAATAGDQMAAVQTYRKMLAAVPTPAPVATEAVAQNARDAAFIDVVTHGQGFLQIGADGMETHIPAESVVHEAVAQGGGVDAERAEIIASLHGIAEFVGSPIAGGRGKWKRHALTAAALLASPAVPVGDGWMPIETAPKDGTFFIATGFNYGKSSEPRHYCMALWEQGEWREASEWNGHSSLAYLTHWQPLPPAPSVDGEG